MSHSYTLGKHFLDNMRLSAVNCLHLQDAASQSGSKSTDQARWVMERMGITLTSSPRGRRKNSQSGMAAKAPRTVKPPHPPYSQSSGKELAFVDLGSRSQEEAGPGL